MGTIIISLLQMTKHVSRGFFHKSPKIRGLSQTLVYLILEPSSCSPFAIAFRSFIYVFNNDSEYSLLTKHCAECGGTMEAQAKNVPDPIGLVFHRGYR